MNDFIRNFYLCLSEDVDNTRLNGSLFMKHYSRGRLKEEWNSRLGVFVTAVIVWGQISVCWGCRRWWPCWKFTVGVVCSVCTTIWTCEVIKRTFQFHFSEYFSDSPLPLFTQQSGFFAPFEQQYGPYPPFVQQSGPEPPLAQQSGLLAPFVQQNGPDLRTRDLDLDL